MMYSYATLDWDRPSATDTGAHIVILRADREVAVVLPYHWTVGQRSFPLASVLGERPHLQERTARGWRTMERLPLHVAYWTAWCDDQAEIPRATPQPAGCALLVTSRQRFALDGMATLDLSRLDEAAAVTLLRGICGRLTEEQAKQIAKLCGYLPLALRVSAGLLLNDEALPVERYLSRLADERQRLAHLKDPDDPTRDVEANLLLSYAALDGRTQALFRRLGVVTADASLVLVAAVLKLSEDEADEVLRTLLKKHSNWHV